MKSLVDFLKTITKHADAFVLNLNKTIENYDKKLSLEGTGTDKVSYWTTSLPHNLKTIVKVFDAHIKNANVHWIDYLETIYKNYTNKTDALMKEWQRYKAELKKIEKSRSYY